MPSLVEFVPSLSRVGESHASRVLAEFESCNIGFLKWWLKEEISAKSHLGMMESWKLTKRSVFEVIKAEKLHKLQAISSSIKLDINTEINEVELPLGYFFN